MPTNIDLVAPVAGKWLPTIPRPAFWVVFPLLLGVLSLALSSWSPAYRDLGAITLGLPINMGP